MVACVQSYEAALEKQFIYDEYSLMAFRKYLRTKTSFALAFILAFGACAADPPPMPHRTIAPDKEPLKGRKVSMADGDVKLTLFAPDTWKPTNATLTVHFHTADWFVIQEHIRRGASHPLATFYLGEGSTVYRRAFEDPKRFGRVLDLVGRELAFKPSTIEISSFSAGYGAVREILKQPEYFDRIRTIVLADSMYAALETNAMRQALREHIDVWVPFARAAVKGEKTFVLTYSAVPTMSYASSSECAHALLIALNVSDRAVPLHSSPAASDKDFPLLRRADEGNLHVWGYGGTNAQAHMTHPRHIADLWNALSTTRGDFPAGSKAGDDCEVAGIKLCWCPPGSFRMGSPPGEAERRADESQVEVTLSKGFWMGKYEVTQAQWKRVMGPIPGKLVAGEGDDFPVYWINFIEAEEFCSRMTERAHSSGQLPVGWEFRLPTEAQWEYACRAGTTTAFSFGDTLTTNQANIGKHYNGSPDGTPGAAAEKIGGYPANAWGLHDMHGNEFEWCRDWYHSHLPGGVDPDLHEQQGTPNRDRTYSRVRRGGAWTDQAQFCRSAFRLRYEPPRRADHIGFRIALVKK